MIPGFVGFANGLDPAVSASCFCTVSPTRLRLAIASTSLSILPSFSEGDLAKSTGGTLGAGLEIGQIGVGNDPDPDPNRRVVGKGRSEQGPHSVNAMPWYRTGTDLSGLIPNRSVGRDR